jgi:hypothetical protein
MSFGLKISQQLLVLASRYYNWYVFNFSKQNHIVTAFSDNHHLTLLVLHFYMSVIACFCHDFYRVEVL